MTVIIGAGTIISGFTGVTSANWALDPGVERLWQLGSMSPYDTITRSRQTISLTCYAGGGPTYNLQPAVSCTDSNARTTIGISPAACAGAGADPIHGSFFCESYSYTKDNVVGYGMESYSFFRITSTPVPTYILQGISTGTIANDDGVTDPGVVLSTSDATGYSGNVSAGPASLGEASTETFGIVSRVGGGTGKQDGKKGRANASIPHQEVYI